MSEEFRHIHKDRRRGRAASTNASGRYERHARVGIDDGWWQEPERTIRTDVRLEAPRSAITRNTSPDVPFDRSINPYRGCEHGCIYCFARPSHAWLGLSAGLDFETQLVARPGIGAVLARELSRKSYRPATLAIGTNTDPYQPIEGQYRVMREVLEVLRDFRHPVGIVTKGTLIERDIDILSEMAGDGLAHVGVSVTTLDPVLARRMEPRVPAPARRLATIRALSDAGIPVRVMLGPVVPGLSDSEMERIMEAGADAGAQAASWIMLRLPREVAELFQDWVNEHYPDRANRIFGHLRDMHDGKLYVADWGRRMRGEGPYAEMLEMRFRVALKRLGLAKSLPALRTDLFRVPPKPGDQLDLFA
ncbi:MAG: PA0069 family radical SAM protein [Pseudomonadota bacterium]|nr:PA0069 family radical SAM protein [Pseudomonadota bacterium]